jgi:putative ABC transport system permease protein
MLLYLVRMAFKSLKRNPVLSALMIGAISLGIGVSTTFVTSYYMFSMNPIPHKSDVLFYVKMDNWDPNRPWDDDDPTQPPSQITYRDMVGIMKSEIPTYQGGAFKTWLYIHPDPEVSRPYKEIARMCFGDFFHLFDVPFEYGSGWDKSADEGPEAVVVLSFETNQKLFGGENSVGKRVRIEDRNFTVVGVMSPWRPFPKYYDPHNGPFEDAEEIYMPFELFHQLRVRSAGNTSNWKDFDWGNQDEYLASEAVWIQMWVQLDDEAQKAAYMDFLNSYVEGQKKLGRMLRPTNNKLYSVMEWLDDREAVPEEATSLMLISLLFLIVCALNLIGILLGKFLARAPEVSVRRAMGASRISVFFQHLVECETIGILGGFLGIFVAILGLELVNNLFSEGIFRFYLDGNMLLVAILLSLIAGLIAGAYPAWKICAIPPANFLKEQ